MGKAIRIDVDSTPDPGLGYKIPDDNPFVDEEGTRGEIWAYGIRNIWRCDQDEGDPLTAGALYWGAVRVARSCGSLIVSHFHSFL